MRDGREFVTSEMANGGGIKCCATCQGYHDLSGYCEAMRRLVGYQGPCDHDVPVSVVAVCKHWEERVQENVFRRPELG